MNENEARDSLWISLLLIVIVGMVIGVLGGIAANCFVIGAKFFFGLIPASREAGDPLSFGIHWAVLAGAALLIVGLKRWSKIPRWHGPADTILSAQLSTEPFQTKVGFLSTTAAFISASAGASVGQYGPVLHFGASVASGVRKLIPTRINSEVYLAAGVAAAISAGFNAPIAGVIFASEAVLRHFSVRALAPLAVASITAAAVTNLLFNRGSPYEIMPVNFVMHETIPLLLVVALASAGAAIVFMSSLLKVVAWSGRQGNEFTIILLSATLMAVIGTLVPEVFGLGSDTINLFFANAFLLDYLIIILIAKLCASVLCLGMGLFGGVFSPALFLGACLGSIVGVVATYLGYDPSVVPLMTVVGMACVASSVVGAPIAIVLIVFELTQSYQYAVAAIFSVAICSLISTRLYGYSYFDRQLLLRGFNLKLGREYLILDQLKVDGLDIRPVESFSADMMCSEIVKSLRDLGNTEAYVTDHEQKLLGVVSLTNALRYPNEQAAAAFIEAPSILELKFSLRDAMEVAQGFLGEAIPVLDERGVLCGCLSEGDILGGVLSVQEEVKSYERN